MEKDNYATIEFNPVMALEEFYRTAQPTDLWKLIREDLNSPEAQAVFERNERIELEDWVALRYQTVGHEDLRVFIIP